MFIAFISDRNYFHATSIAIKSVLRVCTPKKIYLIDAGMVPEQIDWLCQLSDLVEVVRVSDEIVAWADSFSMHGSSHVTRATYLKAQLHKLLPIDKVIYLDGDVVVQRDLSELYGLELGSSMIGATYNYSVKSEGVARLGLKGDYFNAGVLVCPLDKWRENRVEDVFLAWYKKNNSCIKYDDQDVFNAIFDMKVLWIPKVWNVSQVEVLSIYNSIEIAPGECGIIHFNGKEKPWNPGYKNRWGMNDHYFDIAMKLLAPLQPDEGRDLGVVGAVSSPAKNESEVALCSLVDEEYSIGLAAFLKGLRKWNPNLSVPFIVYVLKPLSNKARLRLEREYPFIEYKYIDASLYTSCKFTNYRAWGMNPAFRYELFRNPDYEQLIYVDADMLALGSIEDLLAFRGALGACAMPPGEGMELVRVGGFNAGLLSIGKELRRPEIWRSLIKVASNSAWSGNQTVLNLVLKDFYTPLPDVFNMRTSQITMENLATAKIVHFVGYRKPWEGNEPFDSYQLKAAGVEICERLLGLWHEYAPK